ncbi:hypothetical protein CRI94_10035 [Longibacter salinarum]|uniref:Penicillin-binding protein n=2 Tax=Longibacter salinarum TaxID=1850348 RepID=A0A2A8CY64_9BACT|nr:hypothetical protein CRI94_10035 [Longibacter salinarum]
MGTLVVLIGLVSVHAARAQATSELSSFPFLRMESSARAAALGGAFGAVADGDVNGLFYNPALLDSLAHRQVSASYVSHFAGADAGTVAYGHDLQELKTTLAAGVRFLSWDDFDGRNARGEPTGSFGAGDIALTVGASRAYRSRWRYGANIHVIYSSIETASASALTMDAGLRYHRPDQLMTIGASVHHAGVTLNGFAEGAEELPFDVRLSASKQLRHAPFRFVVTAYDLSSLNKGVVGGSTFDHVLGHLVLGTELSLGEVVQLRLGYNHRRSTELAVAERLDLAGLGLGFGLHVSRVNVDYAYNSWSTTGGIHQFTLRTHI